MQKLSKGLWIVSLSILCVLPVSADPYTVKDLISLKDRQAWSEVLSHLTDVPPSQRNSDWNRIVEAACLESGKDSNSWGGDVCLDSVHSVILAEPSNRDFAWKAGKWARLNRSASTAAPFFAKALKKHDARCADGEVQMAMTDGLSQSQEKKDSILAGQTLAFETCWPASQDALRKAFSQESAYFLSNTCPQMIEKKMLTDDQKKTCASAKL